MNKQFKENFNQFKNHREYNAIALLGNTDYEVTTSVQGQIAMEDVPHMFSALLAAIASHYEDRHVPAVLALKGIQEFMEREGVED